MIILLKKMYAKWEKAFTTEFSIPVHMEDAFWKYLSDKVSYVFEPSSLEPFVMSIERETYCTGIYGNLVEAPFWLRAYTHHFFEIPTPTRFCRLKLKKNDEKLTIKASYRYTPYMPAFVFVSYLIFVIFLILRDQFTAKFFFRSFIFYFAIWSAYFYTGILVHKNEDHRVMNLIKEACQYVCEAEHS